MRRGIKIKRCQELAKNSNLAELIGIVLGDGNLYKHSRTESLRVICNSKDTDYIQHIADLIRKAFKKTPSVIRRKNENATVVCLYQCGISKRLQLPCGNKIKNNVGVPNWILLKKENMWRCLKGLFETDGCFLKDEDNYAQFMEFKNNCVRLRKDAYIILLKLGFNPQLGINYVRLARRDEVYRFKERIDFRNYN